MTSRRRRWLIVLFLALSASAAAAHAAAADDGPLKRLDEAVRAAWDRSPALAASQAEAEITLTEAKAKAVAGGASLQLQAEGIGSSFDEKPNAARYVRVGKPFSWPGQARAGRELVAQGERWREQVGRHARLSLAGEVARAWIALAEQQEVVRVLERISERLEEAVAVQREKNELGEVSGSDRLQLELELIDARSRLAQARAERTASRERVVELVGHDADVPRTGDLRGLMGVLDPPPDAPCDAGVGNAIATVRAEQRTELARRNAELVARTKWGRPSAEVEWESIPDIEGAEGFDALGVMLELPLPFGRSGRLAEVRAEAEARRVRAEAERTRREVASACRRAWAMVRSGRAQLRVLEDMENRLEDAEISLAGQFRLGVASYVEYVDGINRLEEVRMRGIEARGDYLRGRARLAAMTGSAGLFPLPATTAEVSR